MNRAARATLGVKSPLRRSLLKFAAASGLLGAIERNIALAQSAPDYKALVCIYLQGGNDSENTLIRNDAQGYQDYAAVRAPVSGINIAQAQLLPIQPARSSPPYGLHPACGPLKALFEQRKLAVVANVGMLVQPSSKVALETQGAPRPGNLFSHTDQELAVESGVYSGLERSGWGGRIADRLDAANSGSLFPALTSTNGLHTFTSGHASVPLSIPESPYFTLHGSGPKHFQFDVLRDAALREMLGQPRAGIYDAMAQLYAEEGIAASSVVFPILQNPNSAVTQFFATQQGSVANQLRTIARLIEGRAQTGMKRQIFYVNHSGYDTHAGQAGSQQRLLDELSRAVKAFQDTMEALGVGNAVTSFTLSDFGRTFKPASNFGTDHGWGSHAFVIGGAVRGGDFYGTFPTLALNGPDDFGKDGRWIPTTSIEQYCAPLVRWFGIPEGDLPYVFPNIANFTDTRLGFMT